MKSEATARLGLLFSFAAAGLACSSNKGLRTSTPVDAGVDRPADVVSTPDMPSLVDRPPDILSDLPGDIPFDLRSTPASKCGNGKMDPGEACDDGNTLPDDGCSAECEIVASFPPGCPPETGCRNLCGDAVLGATEACDDGNQASGDGCRSDCSKVEPGFQCPWMGRRCIPICGDRRLRGTESCDDGNTTSGDGCSLNCLTEPGWDCGSGVCVRVSSGDGGLAMDGGYLFCGDGILSGAEECDEGPDNLTTTNPGVGYGGCLGNCRPGGFCGNGIIEGPEMCDDGVNAGSFKGCNPDCRLAPWCGDGKVQRESGEACDDGILDGSYGGCTPHCQLGPYCGDHIINGPEQCDHGVDNGQDGTCSASCIFTGPRPP